MQQIGAKPSAGSAIFKAAGRAARGLGGVVGKAEKMQKMQEALKQGKINVTQIYSAVIDRATSDLMADTGMPQQEANRLALSYFEHLEPMNFDVKSPNALRNYRSDLIRAKDKFVAKKAELMKRAGQRKAEQFGQKQIAPGVTPDVPVPIGAEPQPAKPGGPVPARPEITLFGGEEVRPEAKTRGELLTQAGAIGISPEQMKKTGAYQGMPPEQRQITPYQQEYLKYLQTKRVSAAAGKDEQEFRQEHSALFSANQRAGKKANEERKVLESIEEAEKARAQEMEQAK